jgi:hypothetical protein
MPDPQDDCNPKQSYKYHTVAPASKSDAPIKKSSTKHQLSNKDPLPYIHSTPECFPPPYSAPNTDFRSSVWGLRDMICEQKPEINIACSSCLTAAVRCAPRAISDAKSESYYLLLDYPLLAEHIHIYQLVSVSSWPVMSRKVTCAKFGNSCGRTGNL